MKIFAYRGVDDKYPENTMQAFQEAIFAGADGIQLDVHFSRDSKLVVFHDDSESRMIEGVGFVRHHTLAELQSQTFRNFTSKEDVHIPSLEEYLEWAERLPHESIIRMKNDNFLYPGMEEALLETVTRHKLLDRTIFASNRISSMRIIRDHNSEARLALLVDNPPQNFFDDIGDLNLEAVIVRNMSVKESFVEECRSREIELWTGVVDRPAALNRLKIFEPKAILSRNVKAIRDYLKNPMPFSKEEMDLARIIPEEDEKINTMDFTNIKNRFRLGKKKKTSGKLGGVIVSMAISIGASALATYIVMSFLKGFFK